jgi:hypothetical protein
MKCERLPEPFADENGQRCVRVPLANAAGEAVTYWETYWELIDSGVSSHWRYNHNRGGQRGDRYVKAYVGSESQTVARLILKAGRGEVVHYRDGNRLNLRPDNLYLTAGGFAKVDCAELLAEADDADA